MLFLNNQVVLLYKYYKHIIDKKKSLKFKFINNVPRGTLFIYNIN